MPDETGIIVKQVLRIDYKVNAKIPKGVLIGQILLWKKSTMKHGHWTLWLQANNIGITAAAKAMRNAEQWTSNGPEK